MPHQVLTDANFGAIVNAPNKNYYLSERKFQKLWSSGIL